MKFCNKCQKQTPTTVINTKEECMVCGETIVNLDNQIKAKDFAATAKAIKSIQKFCKTDQNTGKFTNAQNIGRNVLFGLFLILAGVLYVIGGITLVIMGIASIITGLILIAILLWFIAEVF